MRAAEAGSVLARLTRPHLNQVTVLPPGRPVCKGTLSYAKPRPRSSRASGSSCGKRVTESLEGGRSEGRGVL